MPSIIIINIYVCRILLKALLIPESIPCLSNPIWSTFDFHGRMKFQSIPSTFQYFTIFMVSIETTTILKIQRPEINSTHAKQLYVKFCSIPNTVQFFAWLCLDANIKVPIWPPYQNSGMWMQVSSLPTNSSLQNTPRYQFSLKSETIDIGFKMAAIADQQRISIRNIIIYLEAKFRPNRRIFVFWRPLNGHHSKPTIDINSQHHNLLGIQISSKLEDFYILAAILDSKWPV